ncbi:MAG: hypothetical protein ACJ762_01850 [Solirubrobacteraceae bacterium]
MDALAALAILLILLVVVWVVSAPLRAGPVDEAGDAALEELLAAKEAKYREIRDAELDHQTGKLDDPDWREVDRALRAEAVAILRRIDEQGGEAEPANR